MRNILKKLSNIKFFSSPSNNNKNLDKTESAVILEPAVMKKPTAYAFNTIDELQEWRESEKNPTLGGVLISTFIHMGKISSEDILESIPTMGSVTYDRAADVMGKRLQSASDFSKYGDDKSSLQDRFFVSFDEVLKENGANDAVKLSEEFMRNGEIELTDTGKAFQRKIMQMAFTIIPPLVKNQPANAGHLFNCISSAAPYYLDDAKEKASEKTMAEILPILPSMTYVQRLQFGSELGRWCDGYKNKEAAGQILADNFSEAVQNQDLSEQALGEVAVLAIRTNTFAFANAWKAMDDGKEKAKKHVQIRLNAVDVYLQQQTENHDVARFLSLVTKKDELACAS